MTEHDTRTRARAFFAAGHALAEARLGLPYTSVNIADDAPKWDTPERPLWIGSMDEAQGLLTRLRAGELAAMASVPEESESIEAWGAWDREAAEEAVAWIREHGGEPQSVSVSAQFVAEPANAEAIRLIAEELLRAPSLTMEEIDFLIEAADGDDDALDGLTRYREMFARDRIRWPDST